MRKFYEMKQNLAFQTNSLAAAAGLEDGDLLLQIEGVSLRDMTHKEVCDLMASLKLEGKYGDKIKLVLIPSSILSNCRPQDSIKPEP